MRLQLGDVADVEQGRQRAEHLVDPQADVGRAGEDARLADAASRSAREFGERARRDEAGAARHRRQPKARVAAQRWRARSRTGAGIERRPTAARTCARRRRGSAGSRCSGRGCRRARRRAAGASAACRARRGAGRRAHSDITKPGVQKPHCEPWHSTIACCTGCSAPPSPCRSSTVKSALPSSVGRNWMQALALRRRRPPTTSGAAAPAGASSPTTTVQAPQSPSLQPSLVPVQRASSRSQSRTVRVGAAASTSTTAPR